MIERKPSVIVLLNDGKGRTRYRAAHTEPSCDGLCERCLSDAEITDQRSKLPQNTTKPFDSMQISDSALDFMDGLATRISSMSQKPQKVETKKVQPPKKQPMLK